MLDHRGWAQGRHCVEGYVESKDKTSNLEPCLYPVLPSFGQDQPGQQGHSYRKATLRTCCARPDTITSSVHQTGWRLHVVDLLFTSGSRHSGAPDLNAGTLLAKIPRHAKSTLWPGNFSFPPAVRGMLCLTWPSLRRREVESEMASLL